MGRQNFRSSGHFRTNPDILALVSGVGYWFGFGVGYWFGFGVGYWFGFGVGYWFGFGVGLGCRTRVSDSGVGLGCRTRVSDSGVGLGCRTRVSDSGVGLGCRTRVSDSGVGLALMVGNGFRGWEWASVSRWGQSDLQRRHSVDHQPSFLPYQESRALSRIQPGTVCRTPPGISPGDPPSVHYPCRVGV